ncbi:uncharacterized protein B0T15DRAFT_70667 [Chaetomium strumarium]|uniref:Uncharacterized protein n=1 Tax=Chaetomium strumarium TaxID=1170767 RepID=A0AAJ0M6X1_9PEZI|nr:hypothetical protein B0T15DRAFT_70667 [Chaetomium strumarium]
MPSYPRRHDRHPSPYGSQCFYRSSTVRGVEGMSIHSSSLSVARSRGAEFHSLKRSSSKPKSWSSSLQRHGTHPAESEPRSYSSNKAGSGNTTAVPGQPAKQLREREPAAAVSPKRYRFERARVIPGNTRKDAAAQTDFEITRKDGFPEEQQPPKTDEAWMARNFPLETGCQHTAVKLLRDSTRSALQQSVERELLNRSALAPRSFQYEAYGKLPNDSGGVEHERQRYDVGDALLLGRSAEGDATPGVGPSMHLLDGDQTIRLDQSMDWDMGALLDPPRLLTEHERVVNREFDSHESSHETGNRHANPENLGVEDLEEFIKRIEAEAARSYGRVDDGLSFPYDRFDLVDGSELRRSPLPEAADCSGANDTAILSSRRRSLFEADLSDSLAQTANSTYPDSFSASELYPLGELPECLTQAWRQRGML